MAKAQKAGGQYRQMLLAQQGHQTAETEEPVSFFRIFLCYVILDYTKASVYEVDSARICTEVRKDLTEDLDLAETLGKALDNIWVSGEGEEALSP